MLIVHVTSQMSLRPESHVAPVVKALMRALMVHHVMAGSLSVSGFSKVILSRWVAADFNLWI